MHIARKTLATALALPILVSGCVFVPTTTEYQDPECNVQRHRLELVGQPLDNFNCGSADPEACLAAAVMVGPTTFVVSGSIVLAGNFFLALEHGGENYYLKKTGKCTNEIVKTPSRQQQSAPNSAGQANSI